MGNTLAFPVLLQPPCYIKHEDYTPTGRPREVVDTAGLNTFEMITEKFMDSFLQARGEILKAKRKFLEIDYDMLMSRYPQWTMEDILDLKAQFQSFDLNQDGLIDFNELCHVLDELRDTSSDAVRKKQFEELDEDSSGAVDFEEYLSLLGRFINAPPGSTYKSFYQIEGHNAQLRKLSIVQRIEHGLF